MTVVNPPPIPRIPDSFFKDAKLRAYFDQIGKILFQLYIRTGGGGSASVGDLDSRLTQTEADIDLAESDIDALQAAVLSLQNLLNAAYYSIAANRTVTGNEIIEATDTLTITLDAVPADKQFVLVYHNAGNGKQVSITDGVGTDVLVLDQTVISYEYSSDFAQWIRGA